MKKTIFGIVILILAAIQVFSPKRNRSSLENKANITIHYQTSETVKYILKNACYDCHSNNTEYPWYSNIQPFAWFLNNHIKKGKKELNFDEFYNYPLKKQDEKLEELAEVIRKGEMPLKPYPLLHKAARLTEFQKQQLIDWSREIQNQINYK